MNRFNNKTKSALLSAAAFQLHLVGVTTLRVIGFFAYATLVFGAAVASVLLCAQFGLPETLSILLFITLPGLIALSVGSRLDTIDKKLFKQYHNIRYYEYRR